MRVMARSTDLIAASPRRVANRSEQENHGLKSRRTTRVVMDRPVPRLYRSVRMKRATYLGTTR